MPATESKGREEKSEYPLADDKIRNFLLQVSEVGTLTLALNYGSKEGEGVSLK